MESTVNKAKNLLERGISSQYPQISIRPIQKKDTVVSTAVDGSPTLKRAASVAVVSPVTRSMSAGAQANSLKHPPQSSSTLNVTSSESPVRRSPRKRCHTVLQAATPVVSTQYKSTRGHVRSVTAQAPLPAATQRVTRSTPQQVAPPTPQQVAPSTPQQAAPPTTLQVALPTPQRVAPPTPQRVAPPTPQQVPPTAMAEKDESLERFLPLIVVVILPTGEQKAFRFTRAPALKSWTLKMLKDSFSSDQGSNKENAHSVTIKDLNGNHQNNISEKTEIGKKGETDHALRDNKSRQAKRDTPTRKSPDKKMWKKRKLEEYVSTRDQQFPRKARTSPSSALARTQ